MRVASTQNRSSSSARRTDRGGGARFSLQGPARAAAGGPLGGAGIIGSIDALAALQGLDALDAAGGSEAAMITRGDTLLGDLAHLRDGLLAGGLDRTALTTLERRLAQRRPHGADPELAAILDDIELRVAVELAKQEALHPTSEPEPEAPTTPLSEAERCRLARHAYTATT